MHDTTKLCEKIKSIYPEIGECGGDVDVDYDQGKEVYSVELKQGATRLKTYLEPDDANSCMEDKRCVPLGIQVSQLVDNVSKI